MRTFAIVLLTIGVGLAMAQEQKTQHPRWIHPACTELPAKGKGVLVALSDGTLMTIQGTAVLTSADDGATWSEPTNVYPNPDADAHGEFLLRTRKGTLLCGGLDMKNLRKRWKRAEMTWADDFRSDFWVSRSLDEGKTWEPVQKPFPGVYGTIVDIKQMSTGHIVVPVETALPNPGRWAIYTFVSADDGKTWTRSNIIDLGGRGHHDGAIEPTLVELRDGRIYMLIRTTLGRFWEAISEDHGYHWRKWGPSPIDASSSPGYMLRLASGRIALVWNRLYPEGQTSFTLSPPGDGYDHPVNHHRTELSIAFSEDEARTWTKPVVIARQPEGYLAYPFVLERNPGELWVMVRQVIPRDAGPLALRLREAGFVRR